MPAVVHSSTPPAVFGASGQTSVTTAAFSPPPGSVLVATTFATPSGTRTATISNSGPLLDWYKFAERNQDDSGGLRGSASVFYAVLRDGASNITVTATAATAPALQVYVVTGADLNNPPGATVEGSARTQTLTTSALVAQVGSSLGIVVAEDGTGFGTGVGDPPTPTSSGTTVYAVSNSPRYRGLSGTKAMGAAGSSTTFSLNFTVPNSLADINWVAVEIRSRPPATTHQGTAALRPTAGMWADLGKGWAISGGFGARAQVSATAARVRPASASLVIEAGLAAVMPPSAKLIARAALGAQSARVRIGQAELAATGLMFAAYGQTAVSVVAAKAWVLVDAIAAGPLVAAWTPPPALLKDGGVIRGSLVLWDATIPPGGAVIVETSTNNGATWQQVTNGEGIPTLHPGLLLSNPKALLARVTLSRAEPLDDSPRLHRFEAAVTMDYTRREFVQLGRFLLNEVTISDGQNGLEIEVAGADLARKVSRNRWNTTFVIREGTNVATAIQSLIRNRFPACTFNFCSTEETTPRMVFGEQSQNDPWSDCQELAMSAGLELFFDPYGICTLRPQPDPAIHESAWTFDDRANPTITDLVRGVTDQDTYNYVVVTGDSTTTRRRVRGIAADRDPSSPTYIFGPYGLVTLRVTSSAVKTGAQAVKAANALLLKVKGATETVSLSAVPMPAIEPSDVITVVRDRSKVEGQFVVEQLHIPLAASQPMRAVCRRQRY